MRVFKEPGAMHNSSAQCVASVSFRYLPGPYMVDVYFDDIHHAESFARKYQDNPEIAALNLERR